MFRERSITGILLEWRPHPLDDVLRKAGIPGLDLEPVVLPSGELPDSALPQATPAGVSWTWGSWRRVELSGVDPVSPSPSVVRLPGSAAGVAWEELGNAAGAEVALTPDAGVPLACLLERPVPAVELRSPGGRLEVAISSPVGSAALELIRFKKNGQGGFAQVGQPAPFQAGDSALVCPVETSSQVGALAVVQARPRRRYVRGWSYVGGHPDRLTSPEEQRLRQTVERRGQGEAGTGDGLAVWPRRSRQRLHRLASRLAADGLEAGEALLLRQLTGSFRRVVLSLCGAPVRDTPAQDARVLASGGFSEAVRALFPALPDLEDAYEASEKLWLLRHAADPGVSEAFKIAVERSEGCLDRTLLVLVDLKLAQSLRDQLREGTAERVRADRLLAELQSFTLRGGEIEHLRADLGGLAATVKAQGTREVDPEEGEPVLVRQAAAWRRCRAWRWSLTELLGYCEEGTWGPPVGEPPGKGELERRLERLAPPLQPRLSAGPMPQLEQAIESLIAGREAELVPSLRELAFDRLNVAALPYSDAWGALHAEIRRSHELRPSFLWLDCAVPAPSPKVGVNARAAAAQDFLALKEAVEEAAKPWQGKRRFGTGRDLLEILATPGHPRAAEIRRSLGGSTPKEANGPRGSVSPRTMLEWWWAELADLDRKAEIHERHWRERKAQAWKVFQDLRPEIDESLASGSRRPESPPFFPRLRELAERCRAQGLEDVDDQDLVALFKLLNDNPRWRNWWRDP